MPDETPDNFPIDDQLLTPRSEDARRCALLLAAEIRDLEKRLNELREHLDRTLKEAVGPTSAIGATAE